MDKQRIIEIAQECTAYVSTGDYEYVCVEDGDVVFKPTDLRQFTAVILLEAAKVCPLSDCTTRMKLEQLAKELTQ